MNFQQGIGIFDCDLRFPDIVTIGLEKWYGIAYPIPPRP
jgi:hypothetical protein